VSVSADLVAQRSNRNSKSVGRAGPVSLVRSQRLKNELALDAGELLPNQIRNTFAVEWGKPKRR
jgi:hypothetical protein